jgi:membrane complex biogenesis BtpA family protein
MAESDLPVPEAAEIKPVVAMIHIGALPGTPKHRLTMSQIVNAARTEARLYQRCGVNCLMIENMHDVPYLRRGVGPEIVAAMTLVAQAVKTEVDLPVGLQILAGADLDAMAVAHAAGLDFIRAECFSFAHVADEGMMESNAAKLLRYRRTIGAERVEIWADIKKKHASHALTADLTLADVAEAVEFMGAETVIVTGATTGRPPRASEVEEARNHCQLPVFVGSGVGLENLAELLGASDGVIVGSHFKKGGLWSNEIDEPRVQRFMEAVLRLNPAGAPATPAPPSKSTAPLMPSLPSPPSPPPSSKPSRSEPVKMPGLPRVPPPPKRVPPQLQLPSNLVQRIVPPKPGK